MSVIDGGWALIAEATANRRVDSIIAACVDEIDVQLPMMHALYEMLYREHQYEEVALILRVIQGGWV